MRNRYKEVLKKYEEDKNYCDEVIVSYEMSAEEIKQLGNIVKILKHKKYKMCFDYVNRLAPEE